MEEKSKQENNYYVYILLNNLKAGRYSYEGLDRSFLYEPFYVGKGRRKRYKQHFSGIDIFNKRKQEIINKIKDTKEKPFVEFIINNTENDKAFRGEEIVIRQIGRIDNNLGPLVNLNNGGGGSGRMDDDANKANSIRNSGEKNANCVWSRKQVLGVINLLANGWLTAHIKTLFKMKDSYLEHIKAGTTYKHLKNEYPHLFEKIKRFKNDHSKINPKQIKRILELQKQGFKRRDIIKITKIDYRSIDVVLYFFDKYPYMVKLKECNLL